MFLRPVGIQNRTITAILGTVTLVFALFSLGLVYYRTSIVEMRVRQTLSPYAELIGAGATPAMEANDPLRAQKILNSLSADSYIRRADIIMPGGRTLATYPAQNPPLERSAWDRSDGAYLAQDDGEWVRSFSTSHGFARVFLRMRLAGILPGEWQTLKDLWLVVGLVLSIFAWWQLVLLRRWVISPLEQLAAIAESAGQQGDYSARMPAHDRDEFGQLGKRFNALLAAVEQRETRLKERETQYRLLFENMVESRRLYEELVASVPLGVYRFTLSEDERPVFEYVSERFCEITGLAQAVVLADPEALAAILHPGEHESFAQKLRTAVRERMAFDWEGQAQVNTQTRWLHLESRPTLLPGRPPFWTGILLDVTDRRDVEEALHQQHSLLEGTLQATADGILAVSSEGRITSYNRQFLELWRVPREILQASDIAALAEYILAQLSNPESVQPRIRIFNDPSKADTFDTLEFTDGRVYERFSRPQLVADRVVGRVWSFRDVTARHWAVASLRESEHKFKMLFESANDAILIMNETAILDCNQVSETMYGSPREKIIGQSLTHFSPEQQPDGQPSAGLAAGKIRATLAGTPQFFEWLHTRADGTRFNAETNLSRLELRGQPVIQAIVRDITARKLAEAAQREAEQLYRNLVDTLKRKNSELERFTYTVSHDLRSPLITIKGFAGGLQTDAQAGRTDRLAADLKRIVLAADKMSDLLNGLLELSRVGRIVNPPRQVSMARITQDVLELLAGSIAQRQARITVQPDLPPVHGDPQRLQEVLQNLVENALKFSLPGRPPEIEIGCDATASPAVFFVRDQGRGLEERFRESIFGLFNKLDPRSDGAGIGLALVRRIVEFHGGIVWVESPGLGQGATFYFTLPGRQALSAPAANAVPS